MPNVVVSILYPHHVNTGTPVNSACSFTMTVAGQTAAARAPNECECLEDDHDLERARLASLASQPCHNCPPQPASAGPSSSSLVARLSGGGRGEAPAMYHQPPHSPSCVNTPTIITGPSASRVEPHETLSNTPDKPMETWPRPKRTLLTDRLKEASTMFPVDQRGHHHQAIVLLNSRKYLHVQVQQSLYQFEAPHRNDVERAISAGYTPAMFGAVPPGAVHLLNTTHEIDNVYAHATEENNESHAPNARATQCLITWINRYLADVDVCTGMKPARNPVTAYALSQWHPPTWMAAKGKSKHENYKPSVTGLAPYPPPAYEECQAGPIEAREEPAFPRKPVAVPQVERPPPVVETPPAPTVTHQVTTPSVPVVLPVIDRGFVLEGYFAPWFHYDSNRHGWRRNFTRLFAVAGWYRAIVKSKGLTIVPGAKGTWDAPKDVVPSPADIAQYLARNGLSFQEADDLYSWGISFLQDESDALQEKGQQCHDGLTRGDYLQGTPEDRIADRRPLEYYLECAQELGLSDFWDVEPIPTNVNSLSGVEVVGGVITATDCDDNWDFNVPTASNVQQMDVDDSGPAPM
ncbi:hypothetical protein PISMIDRAFT_15164 [Pisolithus microcarpus 441]|uniref:Uncharacterized protein n=1 Tax=Pisolithus microcarpus 441 TaxID=765257 RepID=A0A0C9YL28_9AGAM|nr:hypothetical protein BKA83DRAFT_15164 [Pisolithus microcarpus]KIK17386.1 hypothetical protein PISMIDRAFT_15164 [Pisolithus microcarpus 441]